MASNASTYVFGINNAGNLAGFVGNDGANQAFVDVGSAVTQYTVKGNPTVAFGIDSFNNTVGQFVDSDFIIHGFYRDASGIIIQIDYPGATNTSCLGINDLGVITGYFVDNVGSAHGFAEKNGRFRTVPIPSVAEINDSVAGINDRESFVGSYIDKNQESYGYVATPVVTGRSR